MSHEWWKRYRPRNLKQIIGQPDAVRTLEGFITNKSIPHAILFSGASGCGKTTLARILKKCLDCHEQDFCEINTSDSRGIDTIREVRSKMGLSPIGKCRIYYFDECHKWSSDAMAAMLKMLEDTPSHVYFLLATTDPQKLSKTIHTRCTEIRLGLLQPKHLKEVIARVLEKESIALSEEVIDKVIESADGSARKALVLLEQVASIEGDEQKLDAILKSESKRQAIEIARLLMQPGSKWTQIAAIIKEVDEEPETIRHMVLSYATTVLLGGGKLAERAYLVIASFEANWYDSKKVGLVRACWEVLGTK